MQYEVVLGMAEVAALAAAAGGFVLFSRVRPPRPSNLPQAFRTLARSIEVNMQGLPAGFTWGETLDRLRDEGVRADWGKMREALASYEAYRYGGKEATVAGKDEVIELAMAVRRGIVGNRTKG